MSHKDNMDLRNTGDGGWFYAEHELFSVFAPLIGPLGVSVYMAMCRLVPLAAVDPMRQVTERTVMEAACVSKGTAGRKMAEIVALGMVEEKRRSNRRASSYKLVSLRQLALVGISELKRRLGAPQGGTEDEVGGTAAPSGTQDSDPWSSVGRGDAGKGTLEEDSRSPEARSGRGENGAPQGGTNPELWKTSAETRFGAPVPQKQGVGAPPVTRPLIMKKEDIKELKTPQPPKGGQVRSLAASADLPPLSAQQADELRHINELRAKMVPPLPPLDRLYPAADHPGTDPPSRRRRRR